MIPILERIVDCFPYYFTSIFLVVCHLECILCKWFSPWISECVNVNWHIEYFCQFISFFWNYIEFNFILYRWKILSQMWYCILNVFYLFLCIEITYIYFETQWNTYDIPFYWNVYSLESYSSFLCSWSLH